MRKMIFSTALVVGCFAMAVTPFSENNKTTNVVKVSAVTKAVQKKAAICFVKGEGGTGFCIACNCAELAEKLR